MFLINRSVLSPPLSRFFFKPLTSYNVNTKIQGVGARHVMGTIFLVIYDQESRSQTNDMDSPFTEPFRWERSGITQYLYLCKETGSMWMTFRILPGAKATAAEP